MSSLSITTKTTASACSGKSVSESVLNYTLAALYILLTAISALSIFDGIPTALKLAHMPIIAFAMLSLCLGVKDTGYVSYKFLVEYVVYILLMIGITSIIYAVSFADASLLKRGYEKLFFQLLTVLIAVSAYYLFGKKAMDYTFYGFVIFNTVCVLLALKNTGPSQMVGDVIHFLTSGGDAQGFMKYLELHDGTFAFGVFLIYYMMKGVKEHKWQTAIAAFYFGTGFKRIGIIAIIVVIPVYCFLNRKKDISKAAFGTGMMFAILGFAYVFFTYFRVFEIVMTALNVDTMGRNELYEFVRDYYRIDVLYPGRGFEYITQLMKTATYGTLNMAKIGAIHNGYLTVYIELGFFGFFIWLGFWLIWHMQWMKQFGKKALMAYILVTIYLYITYFTDNTAFYFLTGICARLLPMVFAKEKV